MAYLQIYKTCYQCAGGGQVPVNQMTYEGEVIPPSNPRVCDLCNGSGKLLIFEVDGDFVDVIDDILDKVNDLKEKVDEIKEKVDEL